MNTSTYTPYNINTDNALQGDDEWSCRTSDINCNIC